MVTRRLCPIPSTRRNSLECSRFPDGYYGRVSFITTFPPPRTAIKSRGGLAALENRGVYAFHSASRRDARLDSFRLRARPGMDRVGQPGGSIYRQLPEPAEGDAEHLPVAVRRRTAGARLYRRAGTRPLLDDRGRLQPDREDPDRQGAVVRDTHRRLLWRHRFFRRRTLAARLSGRARPCDVEVPRARRAGDAVGVDYHVWGRRSPDAPGEPRRIEHDGRALRARSEAVHHRGDRSRRLSGAAALPAVVRVARRERQGVALPVVVSPRVPGAAAGSAAWPGEPGQLTRVRRAHRESSSALAARRPRSVDTRRSRKPPGSGRRFLRHGQ